MNKYIKTAKNKLMVWAQPRCLKSRKLSALYYLLFDPSFEREQQAALTGKLEHNQKAKELKANYFLLVRNTHRIEKGLLMRPRKDNYALQYIEETIDSFEGVWKYDDISGNPQMKWFYDVLSRYFEAVQENEKVKRCYERFRKKVDAEMKKKVLQKEMAGTTSFSPYFRPRNTQSAPTYEEFYNLTRQRRSVRWFLDKPVPRNMIDKAILAAVQSPSACNRQPFEFRIFDNPELVKEIAHIPMGTKGYSQNIKAFVVLVGNLDAYFDERDRHNIYIDGALAAMSFMLALESMGLSSCSVNWPDIELREKKMEQFLKLKKYQRPVICLSVGFPDPEGMVGYSAKRPLDKIRRYNYE